MKEEKKKILIITSTFPRWANDTDPPFVLDLCKRLKNSFLTHVLCPGFPKCKINESINGVNVKRFRYFINKFELLAYDTGILNKLKKNKLYYLLTPFFVLSELLVLIRHLLKEDFAVVNPHWLIPQGIAAVIAGIVTGKSNMIVCTVHGGDIFSLNGWFLNYIKKFTIKRLRMVLVVSQAMKEKVISLGADEKNVHVIPMGVDLKNKFVLSDISKKKRSILFVGRLVEKKGLKYLIDAFNEIQKKYFDASLVIVGKGPEETNIRNQISKYQIESSVKLMGAVTHENLHELYQSHELAVFPFIEDSTGDMEGFGLVMVEAMGCGCAVVASGLPAVHDIIIDNETGLLIEQKNTSDIVKKVSFLFDNSEILERLSRQGRRYVEDRFDWTVTEEKYCALFNSIIKDNEALITKQQTS
jgi:glycosyltransferase involved in cell wall biosynthesis